jgi:serine/threonine protein kinase
VDEARDALNSSRFPKPNEKIGRYLIEDVIDHDNSGMVFKTFDESGSRSAFVKVLSSDFTKIPSFLDVLRIQMQAGVSANHRGIAALYEITEADEYQYFAYEHSPSGLLSQEVVKQGRLNVSDALTMMIQCAEILQAAAELMMFHGNLRLNSILIFPDRTIKISEIGFVAAVRALFGAANLPVYLGPARFLAPEMTGSGAVDHRADIYSLGMILYFLLFSPTPIRYEEEKLEGTSDDTEVENVEDILKVIAKMTENNPEKRYQDYESLLRDLRSLSASLTPAVKTPTMKPFTTEAIRNQKLFKLMSVLFASGTNGALTVIDGDARKTFYIRNRDIIYFESNQPEDDIWRWLIDKKEIDAKNLPPQHETLQPVLTRVLSKGGIRFKDFKFRYQELAKRVLSELLKNPSAESEFLSCDIEGEALCKIPLSGLLLKAARYTIDLKDVLNEIKPDSFLDRTPLFDHLISGLSLTEEESMLVSVSKEGIFTGNLRIKPGSSGEKGVRFLFLMKQMGALELRGPLQPQLPTTEAQPEPVIGKAVPEDFELEEKPDEAPPSDWVRMEIQKTTKKVDSERLKREADYRYEQARECFQNEKYWEAANLCEQALNLREDSRYYWLMGLSFAQHPRFKHKAEDCFHRALTLDPLNDEIHIDLADFYVAQGLFLRARTHAMKALQIIPDQIRAHQILDAPEFAKLGTGGCCCEHDPGCNHAEHRAWRK